MCWWVFGIYWCDVIVDSVGYVLELVWVVLDLVEEGDVLGGYWGFIEFGDYVWYGVFMFVVKVGGCEVLKW